MGPNPKGPREKLRSTYDRYLGLHRGLRNVGPVGQISWIKVCLVRETVMIRCRTRFWEGKLEMGKVLALASLGHQEYLSGPIVCNVL